MSKNTLTLTVESEDSLSTLASELETAAQNGEGITIRTAGGSFTVDVVKEN